MQKNLYQFSGAKTYAQLKEYNSMLHKDGKLRPYQDFKEDVLKTNTQYNRNYLQAEFQTARQAGHHARNWQQFQKDKDLFPNLQYLTTNDDRVRPDHVPLHGVIKPIDDPFWDTYYPPNGWRCRCYVIQTPNAPTQKTIQDDSVRPEFRVNVGKTGQVYGGKHPYFTLDATAGNKKLNEAFELAKLHAPYTQLYKSKTGATVKASPFADLKDLPANYATAVKLAENNISVKIRPHIVLNNYKNPEYEIEGKLADRKSPISHNFRNVFKKATKQGGEIVVLDISKTSPLLSIKDATILLEKILRNSISHPKIKKVMLVSEDNKVLVINRKKSN